MSGDRKSLDSTGEARPSELSGEGFSVGNPMRGPPPDALAPTEESNSSPRLAPPAALVRTSADRHDAVLDSAATSGSSEGSQGGDGALPTLSNPMHDVARAGASARSLVVHSPAAPGLRHTASKRITSSGDLDKKGYHGSPLARRGAPHVRFSTLGADDAGGAEAKPPDGAIGVLSGGASSLHAADELLPWRHSPIAALRRNASRNLAGSDDFALGATASRADSDD